MVTSPAIVSGESDSAHVPADTNLGHRVRRLSATMRSGHPCPLTSPGVAQEPGGATRGVAEHIADIVPNEGVEPTILIEVSSCDLTAGLLAE